MLCGLYGVRETFFLNVGALTNYVLKWYVQNELSIVPSKDFFFG